MTAKRVRTLMATIAQKHLAAGKRTKSPRRRTKTLQSRRQEPPPPLTRALSFPPPLSQVCPTARPRAPQRIRRGKTSRRAYLGATSCTRGVAAHARLSGYGAGTHLGVHNPQPADPPAAARGSVLMQGLQGWQGLQGEALTRAVRRRRPPAPAPPAPTAPPAPMFPAKTKTLPPPPRHAAWPLETNRPPPPPRRL